MSIENAKKLALGTEVTIEGSVTVASGTFGSSFSDEGFQVQDKTGGMYITIKTDLHLTLGQKVRLTGKLTETALKFQIIETDENRIQVLSGTTLPKPVGIATGKISGRTIGKLIKIAGTVTKTVDEIPPYGFRFSVDDGTGETIVYISTSTGISSKQMVLGKRVELIGVAGEFNHRYQIYPRSPADVKLNDKKTATKGH
jgi:DNA/RNA endonuclease YhcR with UshA esterase domain